MKFGIFVHPKRPRIAQNKILKVIQSTGVSYSTRDPDIAIVVGGDGTFSYYGRTLSIPMLFVGVNDPDMLGSKAKLAQILFGDLSKALDDINERKYIIDEKKDVFCELQWKQIGRYLDRYLLRKVCFFRLHKIYSLR